MTSSRRIVKKENLPASLPSMWRLCRLGLRYEPTLMLWSFGLALLAAVPDALLALWFKLMADAVASESASATESLVVPTPAVESLTMVESLAAVESPSTAAGVSTGAVTVFVLSHDAPASIAKSARAERRTDGVKARIILRSPCSQIQ